jgi:hypothetical protein
VIPLTCGPGNALSPVPAEPPWITVDTLEEDSIRGGA